jgi:hypothetical protein
MVVSPVNSTAFELLARVTILPIRILSSEATEEPEFSAQRLRVKILHGDVDASALALIFAVAVLSFHDARPRGMSDIDYIERDEWTVDDLCGHLRFWKGALCLDADYVRGRMMKTRVTVWPNGVIEIQTTMASSSSNRPGGSHPPGYPDLPTDRGVVVRRDRQRDKGGDMAQITINEGLAGLKTLIDAYDRCHSMI